VISEQEAIERAVEWVKAKSMPYEGREIEAGFTRSFRTGFKGRYEVVFQVPEGTLGGDWTLTLDANTGEVLHADIAR
jgi:hypothetical protein